MNDNSESICDKTHLLELTGTYNLLLENFKVAQDCYEKLVSRNQENSSYIEHLILSKQISNPKDIQNEYYFWKIKYPKSRTIRILLLKFLQGPLFEKEIYEYLKTCIQKGIISSSKELKFIYLDKDKTRILQSTLIKMVSSLKFFNSFEGKNKSKEPKSSFVWCHFFLASHLDKIGKHDKALDIINTVIGTGEDDIDLMVLKAKILKHKNEPQEAMSVMIEAQKLDQDDKCLASKCVKYMIRADSIDEALRLHKKFDLSNSETNKIANHWLILELCKAYKEKEEYLKAYAQCLELKKSFENIWEDQLDFHVYGLTKMRLCNYVEMLRLEDTLYLNKEFEEVAHIAIDLLVNFYDNNLGSSNLLQENCPKSNGQKKKGTKSQSSKTANSVSIIDSIPKNPLEEANKFLKPLEEMFGDKISTHLASYQIHSRKKKPLLMLQAIVRMQAIDKTDKSVVETVTKFYDFVTKQKSKLSDEIISVVKLINV